MTALGVRAYAVVQVPRKGRETTIPRRLRAIGDTGAAAGTASAVLRPAAVGSGIREA